MEDVLSNALDKLRASSFRLNQLTDEAGAMVAEVEDFLNQECSIGVPVYVSVKESDDCAGNGSQYLGYQRVGVRFRIAVSWGEDPREDQVKPWSDCTRAVKIETLKMLPDLIGKIGEKVDETIAEVETALSSLSQTFHNSAEKEA